MPTNEEITRHDDTEPGDDIWVDGPPPVEPIVVAEWDPRWPRWFDELEQRIRSALGERALAVEHVGSTSVPGLPAKPIVDVDLTVADSNLESAYVPHLKAAGFVLTIRERSWHEHRLLIAHDPRTHLHVWSPGSPEAIRHVLFRDWLREHPDDRRAYAAAKRDAALATNLVGGDGMAYNLHKQPVIREILDRVFRAHGLL